MCSAASLDCIYRTKELPRGRPQKTSSDTDMAEIALPNGDPRAAMLLPKRGFLWCLNFLQPYCSTVLGGDTFRELCMSAMRYYNAADSDIFVERSPGVELAPWQVIELLQASKPFFDVTGLTLDSTEADLHRLDRPSQIMVLVGCAIATHLRDGTMPGQANTHGLAIFQTAFALLPVCLFGHPRLATVKAGAFVLAYLMRANRIPAVISLCGSLKRLMEAQGMHKAVKSLPADVVRDRQSTMRAIYIVDQQVCWSTGTTAMRAGHDVSVFIFEGKTFSNVVDLRLARIGADLSAEDHRYSCSRYIARVEDAIDGQQLPLGLELKQLFLRLQVYRAKLVLEMEGDRPVWSTDSGSVDEINTCASEAARWARIIMHQSSLVRGDLTTQILHGAEFQTVMVAATFLFVSAVVSSNQADVELIKQVCRTALAQMTISAASNLHVAFSFCLQCADVAEVAIEQGRRLRQKPVIAPSIIAGEE